MFHKYLLKNSPLYLRNIHFFVFILISFLLLSCCSSSKTCNKDLTYYTGTITVVGNEPFTNLAIRVEGKETFLLDCEKELTAKLWKEQGKKYKIGFCETKKKSRGTALVVVKAEPVKSDN